MNEAQSKIKIILEKLSGTWLGEGKAAYPTISTFPYREELTFSFPEDRPYLHYNQRTWRTDEHGQEVPSHWETGFWRILPENEMELLCAQSSGRVEVDRGLLSLTDDGFILNLQSILIGNDTRTDLTRRTFELQGDTLFYSTEMQTGAVSSLTLHTSARLKRAR